MLPEFVTYQSHIDPLSMTYLKQSNLQATFPGATAAKKFITHGWTLLALAQTY